MILAIDIGGTAAKMGLMDQSGKIYARQEVSVNFDHYETPILKTVINTAVRFVQDNNATIEGIGVSATGQVDTEIGAVVGTNGRIANYDGAQIKKDLEAVFHVPVWVLNDANAAALGECFLGAGKGYHNVLMITLGTGVGGGLILNGQLYGGSRGLAGELGHFTLYQNGIQCACGKRGCYECYASTTALVRQAKVKDGRTLFTDIQQGNRKLQEVLNNWLNDVAAGVTGLVHIFNPELVLIGGGVSTQEELLLIPLRNRILKGVMPRFAENLRIERATLGNDAGMIGALKFQLDKQYKQEQAGR